MQACIPFSPQSCMGAVHPQLENPVGGPDSAPSLVGSLGPALWRVWVIRESGAMP